MATIAGTITGCHLVQSPFAGSGSRKTYYITASFGTYTASTDSGAITTADTAIASQLKNGKTLTLRQAMGAHPGFTSSGAAVYALNVTVSGSTLTMDLGGTTAEANCAASTGVGFFVSVDES